MNIVGAILFLIINNKDLILPFIVGMVSSSELSICVCVFTIVSYYSYVQIREMK